MGYASRAMRRSRDMGESWSVVPLTLAALALVGTGCASEPAPTAEPPAKAAEEGAHDDPPPVAAPPVAAVTPGSTRLLAEAERILMAARESSYTHTTHIDEATGTFDMDCSGFVDYALARAVPDAFSPLAAATTARPVAESYVAFIGGKGPSKPWKARSRAADLEAGDLVAWLEPKDIVSTNTGHVMVVAGAVVVGANEVQVPVIDSSETGHGTDDARTLARSTGIGRGTTVILVDSTGAPVGYRWSTEAASLSHTTKVVLAHLD